MSLSTFSLLTTRRFLPFFLTQLAGAFNDNLFKTGLTLLTSFYAVQYGGLAPALASNLIAGLFILPFLLLSATSGQLADKYDKAAIMRWVKLFELLIVLLAAFGLLAHHASVLYACILLLGVHSAIFGPAKYAFLPQVLGMREVVAGNGLVSTATFVAILAGSIIAGELVHRGEVGVQMLSALIIVIALMGVLFSRWIPSAPAVQAVTMNWNPLSEIRRNLRIAREDLDVFHAMIGISWLWFFGVTFLTHFAPLAKDILGVNERGVTVMLATFSIGIALGSMLCARLSRSQLEIGLVPLGAMGVSVFGIDSFFAVLSLSQHASSRLMDLHEFLAHGMSWRLLVDLLLMSMFSGFFSVPLYAMVQTYAAPSHRARIVAANNFLNALFMVAASVLAMVLTMLGMNVAQILLIVTLLNILVAVYIFRLVPAFLWRFVAWLLTSIMYRVHFVHRERIPAKGAALIVANHVSFVDAFFLMAASPRPIRFVMDASIFKIPVLSSLCRSLKAIPIASAKDDEFVLEEAFIQMQKELEDGQLVCIFPEGRLTANGEMLPFRAGISKVLALHAAPVVPIALRGLWGSFFSRKHGAAMSKPFVRGFFSKVEVSVGEPIAPEKARPEVLELAVRRLRGEWQ